jgi:hypothetical protein
MNERWKDSMKNLAKLPADIQEFVAEGRWKCGCGQDNLRFSVTDNGKVQAHCFSCGNTVFFNDVQIFAFKGGPWIYANETPITKDLRNKKGKTSWYPKHRVRVFWDLK